MLSLTNQEIDFFVLINSHRIFISVVYACITYIERRHLWFDLSKLLQCNPGPWLFVGDFNTIMGAHEIRERGLPIRLSCEEFVGWSDTCGSLIWRLGGLSSHGQIEGSLWP